MSDLIYTLMYLRLLAFVLLIPLAYFSRNSILVEHRGLANVLTLVFVAAASSAGITYFDSVETATYITAFIYTPLLLILVIVWLFTLARNGKT